MWMKQWDCVVCKHGLGNESPNWSVINHFLQRKEFMSCVALVLSSWLETYLLEQQMILWHPWNVSFLEDARLQLCLQPSCVVLIAEKLPAEYTRWVIHCHLTVLLLFHSSSCRSAEAKRCAWVHCRRNMCGFGRWLNWVSDEAWVVTVYRTYKLADRGVVVGGTLKYGDHSLKSHALRGLHTAKPSNCFVHKI